jgi:hypothetical protein
MPRRLLPPPERRRRADVVVAVGLTVAVAVAWTVLWATSPHHGTVSTPAAAAVPPPPAAEAVPAASRGGRPPAPRRRVHRGRAGRRVTGRGAVAGRDAHRRGPGTTPATSRCRTVGAGFPDHDGGGRWRSTARTWCRRLPAPRPGTRDRQRNRRPPGARLLDGGRWSPRRAPRPLEVRSGGPRAHRRVRRRAHTPAGRPTAPPGLRVDGLRRASGRRPAAALPERGDGPHRPHPGRRRGGQARRVLGPDAGVERDAGRGVRGPGGRLRDPPRLEVLDRSGPRWG